MSNYNLNQDQGQFSSRISPVTNKPMEKVQIFGANGKVVTIDIDGNGGVFLDPPELAQLAEIENVATLLRQKISEVKAGRQQIRY